MSQSAMGHEVYEKLRSILAGDPAAAAWLYEVFAPRLTRRLEHRYGYLDGPEVQDLLHDVFVLFLRNDRSLLQNFVERQSPRQLTESDLERRLWDVACGLVANRRRTFGRRPEVTFEDYDRPSTSPDIERATIHRDQLRRLRECLRRGNARVYLYFQLRYRDGLSPEQIARATGWSRKTTYKLKQALNQAVEACIEDLDLEPPE